MYILSGIWFSKYYVFFLKWLRLRVMALNTSKRANMLIYIELLLPAISLMYSKGNAPEVTAWVLQHSSQSSSTSSSIVYTFSCYLLHTHTYVRLSSTFMHVHHLCLYNALRILHFSAFILQWWMKIDISMYVYLLYFVGVNQRCRQSYICHIEPFMWRRAQYSTAHDHGDSFSLSYTGKQGR